MHRLLFALLMLAGWPALAADEIEVMTLQNRRAEDIVPLLQPLVERQTVITGQGNRLIVRGSERQREQVRAVLADLDTAPARLLITVVQSEQRPVSDGSTWSTRRSAQVEQQIATLDGSEAVIRLGEETSRAGWAGRGVNGGVAIEHVPVDTAFTARPRLVAHGVELMVRPIRQTQSVRAPGTVDTHAVDTTVQGRLGEWIVIGASLTGDADPGGTWSTGALRSQRQQVWVRVDRLP